MPRAHTDTAGQLNVITRKLGEDTIVSGVYDLVSNKNFYLGLIGRVINPCIGKLGNNSNKRFFLVLLV